MALLTIATGVLGNISKLLFLADIFENRKVKSNIFPVSSPKIYENVTIDQKENVETEDRASLNDVKIVPDNQLCEEDDLVAPEVAWILTRFIESSKFFKKPKTKIKSKIVMRRLISLEEE